eukprot:2116558-Pleurochrysis_carterae.AAC.1
MWRAASISPMSVISLRSFSTVSYVGSKMRSPGQAQRTAATMLGSIARVGVRRALAGHTRALARRTVAPTSPVVPRCAPSARAEQPAAEPAPLQPLAAQRRYNCSSAGRL